MPLTHTSSITTFATSYGSAAEQPAQQPGPVEEPSAVLRPIQH